jgi:predicted GNAT family acetyltransferase
MFILDLRVVVGLSDSQHPTGGGSCGSCAGRLLVTTIGRVAVSVTDNTTEQRYEVSRDGELAGFAIYRRRPELIAFVHTEIDERFEGEGLASRLVRDALEDARREGIAVLPFCPFVNGYIKRHAEYAELVPAEYRERFGL